jgi:hypothetical protein
VKPSVNLAFPETARLIRHSPGARLGGRRRQRPSWPVPGNQRHGPLVRQVFEYYTHHLNEPNVSTVNGRQVTVSEQMSARWVKSSLSFSNGNCVEAANLPGGQIGVRDSRRPEGPVLRFTPGEWDAFVGRARLGAFDRIRGHTGASPAGRRPTG